MGEKVILAFDFEEYESREEALRRAEFVELRPSDKKRIFVVKEEIEWPKKEKE